MMSSADILIIGGGIIGVSVARVLRRQRGGRVVVIEKEPVPGAHASGRNSGVLHAGVYYKAGTLKARLCVEGNGRMKEFCRAHQVPMNEKGKVIVARRPHELPALKELYERSLGNGVNAALIDERTLKEIEPAAKTVERALYVRETAVVNPQQVMETVVKEAVQEGVRIETGCAWQGFKSGHLAATSRGAIAYGHVVNCAGLHADQVAHAMGIGLDYRILPFRGQFYRLRPESQVKVNGNIYPVPDLRNPFLGVHFTTKPDGEVTIGPSALPLLGREQYRGLAGASVRDAAAMALYLVRLFGRNADHFRSIAWREIVKISRRGFFLEAEGLVRGLRLGDLFPGKEPGIRAQLVNAKTAELLNDYFIESGPRSTHVLNAVSPAFTSSLPFAEYVVSTMKLDR
jgi:L-2-hydroxyglutarate oxidase LhgO